MLREHETRLRGDGSVLVTKERRLDLQQHTTRPPDPTRAYAWKHAMPADEVRRFEAVAGAALRELGYEA